MTWRRRLSSASSAPAPVSGRTKNFPPGSSPSPRTWRGTISAGASRHPNVSLEAETGEAEQTLGSTLPANDPAPNEQALATERAAAVRAAVGKLPEDLREAIVLCEWEDLSIAEAAVILESTPKAVESRLYRARQILRERLKSWL